MNPSRRPFPLACNGIASTIGTHDLDRIDLGIAALKADLHAVGWPSRTPTDDLADRVNAGQHDDTNTDDTPPAIGWLCTCGHTFTDPGPMIRHRRATGHETTRQIVSHDTTGLDHADPTGELAAWHDRHHDDLNEIQDLHLTLRHTLRQLAAIAGRYVPTLHADPQCSRPDCDEMVETNASGKGYRGCVLVAGIWCARQPDRPLCARHRKARERAERAEAEARDEWLDRHAPA